MVSNRCLSAKQKVRQLVICTYFSEELKSKLEALSRVEEEEEGWWKGGGG